jgi:hypothetical protein
MLILARSIIRWQLVVACCAFSSLALPSCGGGTQARAGVVYDYPVEYIDGPPPRYRSYPRQDYRGRPAYLVNGRWYYSSPQDGWVIFRDEPRELRSYRERRYVDTGRSHRARTPSSAEPTQRRRYRSGDEGPTERRRRSVND